ERLERFDVTGRERNVGAFARERHADLPSHSLGRSGHERGPVGELHARYPSSWSLALSAGDRSAGLPKPPPPQVSMTTRSPSARRTVSLPFPARWPGVPGFNVIRNGAASLPPARPYGGTTRRSIMLVSVTPGASTR